MSNSYTIGDLFSMYYEKEFSAAEDVELPDFSARHKRKMKRIFQVFDRNKAMYYNACSTSKVQRPLSIRKRILIAVIIVAFLAVAAGYVAAFVTNSFRGTVYSDNTHLFAFNDEKSPQIIERQYTLSILPEGYELYRVVKAQTSVSTEYRNADNQSLTFEQTVKHKYASHVNTEKYTLQENIVNGYDAVCVEYRREPYTESLIIWNNDEYILQLHGTFAKDELLELANSNEITGF